MSLITSIAEFKKFIAIDDNAKMATLQPFIDEAEQLYIIPLLGQAFYDELLPLYLGSLPPTDPIVALSPTNAKLLPYIQRALAYYTQLLAIPHVTVTFGDMGVRQHRNESSDPAPRWKEEKLLFQALKNGDIHADKLLEFLETNATLTPTPVYGTWYSSSANTKNSGYIVYGTQVASRHININNSRRVFLQLRNKIREIETRSIPKLISQEQYAELVTQIKTDTLTSANKDLIEKIEPIICKRALYMQLPFMRVQINEHGVFVYSGTDDIFKLGQLATDADVKILRAQLCDDKEFGYPADEATLHQFILDNIDDYPLIKASTVYTVPPVPGPTWGSLNDPCNKHFSV
ncbi:MAG TPA: DUF6712 family protein [Ohtaekwangia sp.]